MPKKNFSILLILTAVVFQISTCNLNLYVDSINGADPSNCRSLASRTLCSSTSPCQTLGCVLQYTNASLVPNPKQNVQITLIAPETNPFANNYTVLPEDEEENWLNFTGSFKLTGNIKTKITTDPNACLSFPVLSLQNFMIDTLYINASGGVTFEYLNIQVIFAYQPIQIFNSGFLMTNTCIGLNMTTSYDMAPVGNSGNNEEEESEEEEEEALEESLYEWMYYFPWFKLIYLETGSMANQAVLHINYTFSNIMVYYNGDEYPFCENINMPLLYSDCEYYMGSGLIEHNTRDYSNIPTLSFTNLNMNCPTSTYVKFFASENSTNLNFDTLNTNCLPSFEITTTDASIKNINLIGNYNQLNYDDILNNGATVFDIMTYGNIDIENVIIANYEVGVCYDYEYCYMDTNEPISIISILDNNKRVGTVTGVPNTTPTTVGSRLLQGALLDSQIVDNENTPVNFQASTTTTTTTTTTNTTTTEDSEENTSSGSSSSVGNTTSSTTTPTTNSEDNEHEEVHEESEEEEEENSEYNKNIPPATLPNVTIYSNIVWTPMEDSESYPYTVNRQFPTMDSIVYTINNSITFKNITIANNTLKPNNEDRFFSFIYVSSAIKTSPSTYTIEDVLYQNNTGINAYQHYGFTLYDAENFIIDNVTHIQNKISRLVTMKCTLKPSVPSILITNINISNNNYSMINPNSFLYDPNGVDDASMGIIDYTGNANSSNYGLSNITIANNVLKFGIIITIQNTAMFYQFVPVYTYISDVTLMNNFLVSASLINIIGSHAYINNLNSVNDVIEITSFIDLEDQENQFNSLVIQNSSFYNMSLYQSGLIQKDADYDSALIFLELQTEPIILPFWLTISNCVFESLIVTDNSMVIEFTFMPFAFISNNTFLNINISHFSYLISGNKFVNTIKFIPGVSNHIPDILNFTGLLDQYTSQIFQSSINFVGPNGPYSDLEINYYEEEEQEGNPTYEEEEEEENEEGEEGKDHKVKITSVYITRITNNIFNNITTRMSNAIDLDTCETNIMLLSIDQNIMTNINLTSYTDDLIKFDTVNLIGIAYNYYSSIFGNGNIFELTGHTNAKIYDNYIANNSGPSLLTIMGNNARQTLVNQNIIKDVNVNYTYIYFVTQYNEGQIIFSNNIFFNITAKADMYTYQSINFVYIQISNADIDTATLTFSNNTFANIQFIKNHTLIKQFQNSFMFISNPDDSTVFTDSTLYNISILYDNNLLSIISQDLYMKNTTFSLIYNYESWGSLYFLGNNLYVTECSFQFNFAYNGYGGAIFVDYDKVAGTNTSVSIKSTVFRNNFALMGAAFYYGGKGISFTAENNYFYQGNISLFDTQYIPQDLPLVYGIIAFAEAILLDTFDIKSTILYSKDNTNGFTFFLFSDLVATEVNLPHVVSSFYMDTSNDTFSAIQIINCSNIQFVFNNLTIEVEGINFNPVSLLTIDSGNITVSDINLSFLAGYGSFIELMCNSPTNASLSIIQSTFSSFFVPVLSSSFGIVHISDDGLSHQCFQTVNIVNSTFNESAVILIADWTQDFSAVYVDYPGNLSMTISKTIFQNITSVRGPAVNLNNWQMGSQFQAQNGSVPGFGISSLNGFSGLSNSSKISNSTGGKALAKALLSIFYIYGTSIVIDECNFNTNVAYLEGGAVYNTYNNLTITNSNFTDNQAQYRTGAAIFSVNYLTLNSILNTSNNNQFSSNKRYSTKLSGIYSDEESLGSPPIAMNLSIIQTPASYANITSYPSNNSFLITNVTSYDLKPLTFTIGLIDGLGQPFYESPSGDAELSPSLANSRSVKIFTNSSLGDSSNCDFANCYIVNTTLVLKGIAGSILPVNFSYQSMENIVPNLTISTILRSCVVGEINSSNIAGGDPYQSICTECTPNSYSLVISDSDCTPCDFEDGAMCLGGSNIFVNPGFWRNSTLSDVILECPNDLACIGGINSNCAVGYTGPLCQSCNGTARYARSGPNKCGLCPGGTKQVLVSVLFILVIVAYQIYTIRTSLTENLAFYESGMTPDKEKAKTQGQYIRLLTTYAQIITIVLSFQLQYPDFVQQTVGPTATAAGSPTNTIFASTLCLLIDLGYEPDRITFYKIILVCGIPLLKMILICSGLFIIFQTWKKNTDRILKKASYLITIFCIILIEQPGLFNNLVSYLTCVQINNEGPFYLLSDYGVQCYTSTYNFYLMFIVLPSIIVWGFLIPGILFLILYRYRNKLHNKLLRLNLGGIYNEYTTSAYFWGIVLMVMKLILMLSAAVLYNDVKTEALTIFIILYTYLFAHARVKPIQKEEIYRAEQLATGSYLITIFFAIYYKDNRFEIGLIFAIIVIAIANFFVISLIIYKIVMLNAKSIPCLRKYVAAQDAAIQKEIDNEKGVNIELDSTVKTEEDFNTASDLNVSNTLEVKLQPKQKDIKIPKTTTSAMHKQV